MSESLKQYQAQIAAWRRQYKVKEVPAPFDPTQLKIACRKCERIKHTVRHHTGNDLFFARMMPDVFAPRYCEFRSEDVERLCDNCHKDVHKLYKPLMSQLYTEATMMGQTGITPDWCRKWMELFRVTFYFWTDKKPRRRRRKRRLRTKREG